MRGATDADTGPPPAFGLDGLWVARRPLDLRGRFSEASLRHWSLVPPGALAGTGAGAPRHAPSLVVHDALCPLVIADCVIGRIRVQTPEVGFDPCPVSIVDSVVDASDPRGRAVQDADERPAWARVSLRRVTVLGSVHVHSVGVVEDSILTGPLDCERRQSGEVRFSYIPAGSQTPRRTGCQPDGALHRLHAAIAHGSIPASDRDRLEALTLARLVPRFDAVRFGAPAYARLATDAAAELQHGAHDEGQPGAYHDLWQPLRQADARARLQEFVLPATDIDIRFAT